MSKIKILVLLSFLVILMSKVLYAENDWYHRKYEGWYFYEEKNKKPKSKPEKLSLEKAPEVIKEIQKRLEQLLSLAILDPTEENVTNYMQQQQKWVSQSHHFSKAWSSVILNHPLLADQTPVTQAGIRAYADYETQKRKLLLKDCSKKYFLVLFFEGKDPLAALMLDAVYNFSRRHGWVVKQVSMDQEGLQITGYGDIEEDKERSKIMRVQVTPSLFIVNPEENLVVPVGSGYISGDRIERNIEGQIENLRMAR